MNWLQRFIVRAAARLVPPLGRVLSTGGGTVDRLEQRLSLYREQEHQDNRERELLKEELREAIAMQNGGPWQGSGMAGVQNISESDSKPVARLKERLAELELALEDRGWQRQLALADNEFSRWGIQQIILICRLYFIKNPLIRRGIKVSAMYVFGRGMEISSQDDAANEVLQNFLTHPANAVEWSRTALVAKEESFYTDGNMFLAFFTDPKDGTVILRTIDALEITEIITDPNDASIPWYYHRVWTSQVFDPVIGTQMPRVQDAYYVAMNYVPANGLSMIANKPIMKDAGGNFIPVLHAKVNTLPKWHFGCPMAFAAVDWARAYKCFLEDWCTITRALARFSWNVETQGGAPAIAGFKAALATTLGNDGYSIESNPPPTTGSAFITGPGNKLTPIKTANSTSDPEQGRRVLLMVAAAFGLPETFFGDSQTGSLATAKSLDRPTELQFLLRQEAWRELWMTIGAYVLAQSASAPGGRLRESKKKIEPLKISVKFPSLLEHDIASAISAISMAMTLGNKGGLVVGIDEKEGVRLLLEELGVEDSEAVLEAMYPDDEYDPDRTHVEEPTPALGPDGLPIQQPITQPAPNKPVKSKTATKEAIMANAVKELLKASALLKERLAAK